MKLTKLPNPANVLEAKYTAEQMRAYAKKSVLLERDALEAELLKLKNGVAANSDYIQGRWDLIGEFQDVIRARGEA